MTAFITAFGIAAGLGLGLAVTLFFLKLVLVLFGDEKNNIR